jgi:hypothetical protein
MDEGTLSGKSTIRLLGISAGRPTNGLYLYLSVPLATETGISLITGWLAGGTLLRVATIRLQTHSSSFRI